MLEGYERRTVVLMALVALGLLAYDLYEFFGRDMGPQFYREAPHLPLIPVGLGVSAGVVVWLWPRLQVQTRRRLILGAWTVANLAGSVVAAVLGRLAVMVLWGAFRLAGKVPLAALLDASAVFCLVAEVGLVLLLVVSWRALVRAMRTGDISFP